MKANKAPEKIYIFEQDFQHKDHKVMYGVNQDKDIKGLIEYTRTDAFIEKTCEGIEHLLSGYIIRNFHFGDSYDIDTLLEDFRKYLEESKV